ncbi:L-lactate transporter [subsurface metagenome]
MKLKRLHYSWVLVIAASCMAFINSITTFTFGIFLKPLATEFNSGRAVISGARSLTGLLSGVLGIGVGRLTDRYGPRFLATSNGILAGLGLLLMWQANSVWQIYLFYGVIIAIGFACFQIPIYSTIPRWFTKKRGTALGITQAGFGLGGMILTPLAQWLISSCGWRQSYLILGLSTLVIATPFAQFMKHSPQRMGLKPYGENENIEDKQSPGSVAKGLSFTQAIKTSRFWLFGSILFCFMSCLAVVTTHAVPHATDIGIPEATAASIIALFSGSGIIGKLSIGFISEKIGNRLTLSIYLIGVTLALSGLLFITEIWMFYLFAIVFGLGYGGVITLPAAVTAELFGLKYLSMIFASTMLFGTAGMGLGPILAGSIFDITGGYSLAFLICVILAALSVLLSLILLRYKAKQGVA